uniref:Uncharacterized protein n=1 Tax=Timema shepardi TaxID=629360 RepID=A0A7R9G3J3_TIMSH|nr:unnamed protein product [Timema shepardi]
MKLMFECLSLTIKCEDIEEDDDKSRLLPLSNAVPTLKPSSLPFIKEEIKNELDCHATLIKLERTIESVLHSIIKPETTSVASASDVCEEPGFKEELHFKESSIDNEPDSHETQVKLESTIESVLHSLIKPASDVREELGFKEELCFDESYIDISVNNNIRFGQNFTNENHKKFTSPLWMTKYWTTLL